MLRKVGLPRRSDGKGRRGQTTPAGGERKGSPARRPGREGRVGEDGRELASTPAVATAARHSACQKRPDTAGEIGRGRPGGLSRGDRYPVRRGGPPCP